MKLDMSAFAKWEPTQLIKRQDKAVKKYLFRVGGFLRLTARRLLKKARKIRVSELPDEAREKYREDMEDFQNGYRDRPPVLRDIISAPGEPPKLHMTQSPLKADLKFSVDYSEATVVIGPARKKDGIAGDLEHGRGKIKAARPYMRPAYDRVKPRLPDFIKDAFN